MPRRWTSDFPLSNSSPIGFEILFGGAVRNVADVEGPWIDPDFEPALGPDLNAARCYNHPFKLAAARFSRGIIPTCAVPSVAETISIPSAGALSRHLECADCIGGSRNREMLFRP
jgi:hypothetical protein